MQVQQLLNTSQSGHSIYTASIMLPLFLISNTSQRLTSSSDWMFLQNWFVLQHLLAESSLNPSNLSHVARLPFTSWLQLETACLTATKERIFAPGDRILSLKKKIKSENLLYLIINQPGFMHLQYWYQQNNVPENADYKSKKARVISCDNVWHMGRKWRKITRGTGRI